MNKPHIHSGLFIMDRMLSKDPGRYKDMLDVAVDLRELTS